MSVRPPPGGTTNAGGATGASGATWQLKNPARVLGGVALAALVGGGIFMSTRGGGESLIEESAAKAAISAPAGEASAAKPSAPVLENGAAAAQASTPNGAPPPFANYMDWVRAGSPRPPPTPIFKGDGKRSAKVLRTLGTKGQWAIINTDKELRERLIFYLWSEEKADVFLDVLKKKPGLKQNLKKLIDLIRQLDEGGTQGNESSTRMDGFASAVLGVPPPGDILSRRRFWLEAMLMSHYLKEALPRNAEHLGLSAFGLAWRPEVGEVEDGLKNMEALAEKARRKFNALPSHPRNWFSRMLLGAADKVVAAFGGQVPDRRPFERISQQRLIEDKAKDPSNKVLATYFGNRKVRRLAALEQAKRDGAGSFEFEGERSTKTLSAIGIGALLLLGYNVWARSPGLIPKGPFWQSFFGQTPAAAAAA